MSSSSIEAWDDDAKNYDARCNRSIVSKYMRKVMHYIFLNYFDKGTHLLDIGCGTGIDAIFLGKNGFFIDAFDQSPLMIKFAQSKMQKNQLIHNLNFKIGKIENIEYLFDKKYDGVYSSFGPLNNVKNLGKIAKNLAEMAKPNSIFISTNLNRYCISEMIYYLMQFKLKKSIRRLKKGPIAVYLDKNSDTKVFTTYYTPMEFYKYFKKDFELINFYGIPTIIPPPYITDFGVDLERFFSKLIKFDRYLISNKLIRNFGDHFIIILKRKNY